MDNWAKIYPRTIQVDLVDIGEDRAIPGFDPLVTISVHSGDGKVEQVVLDRQQIAYLKQFLNDRIKE